MKPDQYRDKFVGHKRIAITSIFLLASAVGCGSSSEEDPADNMIDGNHAFSSPQIGNTESTTTIAVGARIDLTISGDASIDEIRFDDPELFEVEELDGNQFSVRALAAGETELVAITGEQNGTPVGSAAPLNAEEAEEFVFDPDCDPIKLADDLLGVPYDDEFAWISDEIYEADRKFYNGDGDRIWGGDFLPFDIDPPELFATGEESADDIELIMGSEEASLLIEPEIEGESLQLNIVHEENIDDIGVMRLEDLEENDPYLSVTMAGEEPQLDIVENETYNFMPHRFIDDRAVCEPDGDLEFVATSKTPDICNLTISGGGGTPDDSITFSGLKIGTLHMESTGECSVEFEYLGGPSGYELTEEFQWTVQ